MSNVHEITTAELQHILYVIEMLEGDPEMIDEEHVQDAYEIIHKLMNKEEKNAEASDESDAKDSVEA